ncbi:MAG: hypothetical protein FD145_528 [Candidatus Saganbacteria bacterium]|uniref:Peptidase M15A C-terminal domain-containing protein n=1 Tax=Candidatus Saganbacteria bacterium TaxID=2575572 RepID=A0A833P3C2_UNCSA|nr:MAG: hypothetical protein FD145_528 [Candidatus Saganbacteria bacterium]
MGDLSEHFNHKDFKCACPECRGEGFKIHLGLVGILEAVVEHFQKPVKIKSAFWCEAFNEKQKKEKLSLHVKGKAVHFSVEGIPISEAFKFTETIPGINGIGFYPQEEFIHIDTRPVEKKDAWIKEGERYSPLTQDKRRQYGL